MRPRDVRLVFVHVECVLMMCVWYLLPAIINQSHHDRLMGGSKDAETTPSKPSKVTIGPKLARDPWDEPESKGYAQSGAVGGAIASPAAAASPAATVTLSKTKVEAQRQVLLAEAMIADAIPRLNLVVVGHVDAGKSTLMGHMLFLKGMLILI